MPPEGKAKRFETNGKRFRKKKAPPSAETLDGADNVCSQHRDYDSRLRSKSSLEVNVERSELSSIRIAPHADFDAFIAHIDSQLSSLVR